MALGFFSKLKEGLARSTQKIAQGITGVFNKRKLDDAALEELEDVLITADLGTEVASRIIANFRRTRFGREVSDDEVKTALAEEIAEILKPVAHPLAIDRSLKPHVVLVVGVNGTGKTTTIGKLAQQYRDQGLKPMLCAGDTFRAAAVEQLQVWGARTGAPVVFAAANADAAGLAFDALTRARAEGIDVLLVDTAGRLHNKAALMDELGKIIRVMWRHRRGARRGLWLAGARRWRRRTGRRPAAIRSRGICPRAGRCLTKGGCADGWHGGTARTAASGDRSMAAAVQCRRHRMASVSSTLSMKLACHACSAPVPQ